MKLQVAFIALVAGLLVYLLDRRHETVYFLPHWIDLTDHVRFSFGPMGRHLPTFLHVYAIILLTAAVTKQGTAYPFAPCAAWFAIDCLFEIGQHARIAPRIAGLVPHWFESFPLLENTADYFLLGTFDPLDIVSIAAGTVAAFLTITICHKKEVQNESCP